MSVSAALHSLCNQGSKLCFKPGGGDQIAINTLHPFYAHSLH